MHDDDDHNNNDNNKNDNTTVSFIQQFVKAWHSKAFNRGIPTYHTEKAKPFFTMESLRTFVVTVAEMF